MYNSKSSMYSMAVMMLLLQEGSAFTHTSSFVRRSVPSTLAAPAQSPFGVTTCRRSNTSLQMNLFDRFQRVAKGTLNDVLKNLEDPEKIMNQALEDMQVRRLFSKILPSRKEKCSQPSLCTQFVNRMTWLKSANLTRRSLPPNAD